MANKCYTYEAKKFEDKLKESNISYNQFLELCTMYHELTIAGKAEVENCLRNHSWKGRSRRLS